MNHVRFLLLLLQFFYEQCTANFFDQNFNNLFTSSPESTPPLEGLLKKVIPKFDIVSVILYQNVNANFFIHPTVQTLCLREVNSTSSFPHPEYIVNVRLFFF